MCFNSFLIKNEFVGFFFLQRKPIPNNNTFKAAKIFYRLQEKHQEF